MEKFFIPREVWRPMNAIEMKEGNKYIVRFKNGSVERMIVEDGQLCYKIGGKEGGTVFPSIEDMHSWIREPYECYLHFENMTMNEIPLEFVLPYILKQRMKAKQEAEEAVARAEQAEANAKAEIEKLQNDIDTLAECKAKQLNVRAVEVIEKAEKIVKDNLDAKTKYNKLNAEHKALGKAYGTLTTKYNTLLKRIKRFIKISELKEE